jgi:hypothetical protein
MRNEFESILVQRLYISLGKLVLELANINREGGEVFVCRLYFVFGWG